MVDERVEHLINRRVDGELTGAESLELDQLLVRSPEARSLLEEYERTYALAREALGSAFGRNDCSEERAGEWARTAVWRVRSWPAVGGGIAAAAAVLLAMVLGGLTGSRLTPQSRTLHPDAAATPAGEPPLFAGATPAEIQTPGQVIQSPRRQQERILRDVFGVFDEQTQSLYLLELDRRQTAIVPVRANY